MRKIHAPVARARRAFTLLELLVVAAVAMVIFAFLIRWVMTLGTVSDSSLSADAAARNTQALDKALEADTSRSTGCTTIGGQIRTLSPTELELYVTATFNGAEETHLVHYQVTGGTVERTEYLVHPETDQCDPRDAGFGTRVLADGLDPGATVFTGTSAGSPTGTCATTAVPSAPDPYTFRTTGTGCQATGIDVTVLSQPQGPHGGRDALDRSYALTQSGGTL